jgi:hypothetical protein
MAQYIFTKFISDYAENLLRLLTLQGNLKQHACEKHFAVLAMYIGYWHFFGTAGKRQP